MIKFLLDRPIAVLMFFAACIILGIVTLFTLPVSLLPDIDIPQITILATNENTSARELENTIVAPVRRQLLQVSGIDDIESHTRDGLGILQLRFKYGVNTDLAFVEVNEKIDAVMSTLPKDTERPKAIKASATDIPILYLNMTLKNEPNSDTIDGEFLNMCKLAEDVVKRRIEQLPEIAIADMTGVPQQAIQVIPDFDKLATYELSIEDIERALILNNVETGSMTIREGYYEYNIRFASSLRTLDDIANIYIKVGDRIIQLKEICSIAMTSPNEVGRSLVNGDRAVTFAIIKRNDENIDKMKQVLNETIEDLAQTYPNVEFTINKNQTELLDFTITNLKENLVLGALLVIIITMVFFRRIRLGVLISIAMMSSMIITFLMFYLFDITFNVISLAGLILAAGLMIDNALVVTENISQYIERGYSLKAACDQGTTEMITPMLSSALTTIAVFLPLIFMSGIAGAIFADQAFSITAGLSVSYIVSITLLPVLYYLFYNKVKFEKVQTQSQKGTWIDRVYGGVMSWVFSHKKICLVFSIIIVLAGASCFFYVPKEKMPKLTQTEMNVRIDWNENIHIDENHSRITALLATLQGVEQNNSAYIGTQNYIVNDGSSLTPTESELYFKAPTENLDKIEEHINRYIQSKYPAATATFSPPKTILEKIFITDEADVIAKLEQVHKAQNISSIQIKEIESEITSHTGIVSPATSFNPQFNIEIDSEKLQIYDVAYEDVYKALKTALNENQVSVLRNFQQYIPIILSGSNKGLSQILAESFVKNSYGECIALKNLTNTTYDYDLKSIVADSKGEYIPLNYKTVDNPTLLMRQIKQAIANIHDWDVRFDGSVFSNERMINELTVVLAISILLMYFILTSQFGGFVQPLIVLLEIPITIAIALITLKIFGHSLNIMSAIGIIVTCGITVNDSILKLNSINELQQQGYLIMDAIHTAGLRRLRPIIMTSLTTIISMVPVLFASDLGSELQQPLVVSMIGSMIIGTLISIFIIPLIYWYIYRK